MLKEIFIIGKPNVGKSSLFNSLANKKLALVQNEPGVTIDLRKKRVNFFEREYFLFDSAGITNEKNILSKQLTSLTIKTVSNSALILFVIDGKLGINEDDFFVCDLIRKLKNEKILVINKCEGKLNPFIKTDLFKLGLGEPVFVSSAHNSGIQELRLKINSKFDSDKNHDQKFEDKKADHSIAIIGKTNSGKSTLINCFTNKLTSITGDKPNLTRDPVESDLMIKDVNFKIFDTAGLLSSYKENEEIHRLSEFETKRKMRLSEIILIILDINNYWEKRNKQIINSVVKESRATIIVINKIDTIKDYSENHIKNQISLLVPQTKKMPIFFVSAKKKIGINELKDGIFKFLSCWKTRINTAKLNKWLLETVEINPPAMKNNRKVKLKYITQINSRPPKFKIFSNFPESIKESYKKYLIRELKKTFNFEGVIIKLIFTKIKNPYEK